MNIPFYIARKTAFTESGRHKSPSIGIGITAVAVSVGIMIAAISIVLGFKHEITEKIISFNSHITLYPTRITESDPDNLELTAPLKHILDNEEYISGYHLEAAIPAILKTDEDFKGIYMRGGNGNYISDLVADNLIAGNADLSVADNAIAVSRKTSRELGLEVGDTIDAYFIGKSVRGRRMNVTAVFDTHFEDYDNIYAFVNLPLIQDVAGLSATQGSEIHLTTDGFNRIEQSTSRLRDVLLSSSAENPAVPLLTVTNVRKQGANYFSWLSMLDTNVAVILSLMAVVACVTLISGLLIIIIEKRRMIGILRSFGASGKIIRRTFVYMALRICLWGILIGNTVALAVLWLQQSIHFLRLDPDSYYIDFVPVRFNWYALIILNISVFVLARILLILPARTASRTDVSSILRYE